MKRFLLLGTAFAVSGCNPEEMQQHMEQVSAPFVVAANEASVTIAAEGNYLWHSKHTADARTVPLAASTCRSLGKPKAVYQSSVDSTEHYNRRNHFFLCVS